MLAMSLGSGPAQPLRFLCLGAHSDDIEIGCGGTILKLLEQYPGSSVSWVVFSANEQREAEARGSAAAFLESAAHSEVIVHRFKESYFPHAGSTIKDSFEELKRTLTPDVVLSHHRHDVHQDHRTIAELTWNTFRNHLILEYEIPKYEGDLGHPSLYVPLSTAQAARKIELLTQHFASQGGRTWFRPDTFRGIMSIRGIECNAADGQAEAFHVRKAVL
jgi:LmbE family N-acetylglucosaminyl deacetylase